MALQAAAREAMARRHPYLTVEHLLYALAFDKRGAEVLRGAGASVSKLKNELEKFFENDLEKAPETEPQEIRQTLAFHRVLENAISHAASAEKEEVEAGDLLAAIFQEPDSHAVSLLRAQGISRLDVLRFLSHGISKEPGGEEGESAPLGTDVDDEEGTAADPLEAYTVDLTQRAVEGKLDPLVGRDTEILRAIHVLARRRKNNPLFVGESGVGKTALAEGLAQAIQQGRVPEEMKKAEVFALDLGSLLAGTRYRGDFEARFKALVAAVMGREQPILFIDEIHTILGAGAAQGATVDASNMLKPLLQSGELRCIGSTTYGEYRHFERDRALARRFQKIDVTEPSPEEAIRILEGLAPRYEEHHGVKYSQPALRAAVELSSRHLTDRFLPDKAIDVIDEVGAAVRLQTGKTRKSVGVRDVENLVARMARIPSVRATHSDRTHLERLEEDLRAVVYGQDGAVATIARAVKRGRAGLGSPERPVGAFLFMGPTGVGKTELAKQLSNCLRVPFLRFDMSEYMEKHAVSRLIGAPPGYVGYDQGGQLVESVRKHPHAVLLLDEIEKAHQDVFNILLQVMDHATLTDNQGREADFRHITLIMTSNVGARELSGRELSGRSIGFGEHAKGSGRKDLERLFSPEFRNRLDEIVTFDPLPPESEQLLERKVALELSEAAKGHLAEKGYDPLFGARPLARVIQTDLKDPLADDLLFGKLAKGGRVRVDLADGELVFEVASD
jgi:ATP-dependent Clp protease ATP-binding subunit ClpA